MLFKNLKDHIVSNYINFRGKKFDKKYLVIQSDDWGSIRTSSYKAYQYLLKKGWPVDQDPYSQYDSLESNEDLEALLSTLLKIKDLNGHNPKFTLNNVVANPDFEKIRFNNYQNYFYEEFTETLQKYTDRDKVIELYQQGIHENIFDIQFHGREHLHVGNWLRKLQEKDPSTHDAFQNNMFSVISERKANCRKQNLDAFAVFPDESVSELEKVITDGISIFSNIWRKKPISVVSPCLIWCERTEKIFQKNQLQLIQGGPKQSKPIHVGYQQKRLYTGEINQFNQFYSVRNVNFEPSLDKSKDWVGDALKSIERAFYWQTPAIISTHRLNYIGTISESNRSENIKKIELLLKTILKTWPQTEFINSFDLLKLMRN